MKKVTQKKKKPAKRNGSSGPLAAALEANRLHISYGEYMKIKLEQEG